jgi:hypothetical protein
VLRSWIAAQRARILPGAYLHYRVDNTSSSVHSSSKVYEVCGEFAAAESFLHAHPDREQSFGPFLQVAKYNTYRWNYDRIARGHRSAFAQRWAKENEEAAHRGILREQDFSSEDWNLLQELKADPSAFAEAHADGGLL